jgi:hypothetical protein
MEWSIADHPFLREARWGSLPHILQTGLLVIDGASFFNDLDLFYAASACCPTLRLGINKDT